MIRQGTWSVNRANKSQGLKKLKVHMLDLMGSGGEGRNGT